jgi:TetR/AcrR family transcriptional regulator, transcriptional repressor of aconitase
VASARTQTKPARPMGRPANADSAATRKAIVAAAAAELASDGYEGMNLESVASAVGITRGAIYRYFDSKRELARAAVIESSSADWTVMVEQVVMPAEGIVEQLRALVRTAIHVTLQDPRPSVGYFEIGQLGEQDDEIAAVFRARSQEIRRVISKLVRDAARRGELKGDADIRAIVDSVSGLVWAVGAGASTAPNDKVRQQILMSTELLLGEPSWLATPEN